MYEAENIESAGPEAGPQNASKAQSAISTKLFLALGFLTVTAFVAGLASILALNRFQENFDSLINRELPSLQDTADISQLSVSMANSGTNLIISPTTWSRENLMAQIADDAHWLKETLDRVSNESLSGNRKQELIDYAESLVNTYNTLNTLTEKRILYTKQLDANATAILQLQQDMISIQFSSTFPGSTFVAPGPLQQWNESIHAIIFNLMEAQSLKHPAPLKRLKNKVTKLITDIRGQTAYLPAEAQLDAEDILRRLKTVTEGDAGLFTVKRNDFTASRQMDATVRNVNNITNRLLSASKLATSDIRQSIAGTNQASSQSMGTILQAMVAFILVSALVAVVTFLYVSRTVLRRLGNLRRSMVAHAEGVPDAIDTSGQDEITDMARSLQYLVDALHSREIGLTHAKEEAEHASTAKTRFLAAASHDLRQPLQALSLFVYALEGKEKDEEKREIITLIRNSLDSLKELLNTLLDISKLEAGVVQANMRDFPAGTMIERIRSELTAVAWANDLQLRTVASSAMVHSDPALLETTVRNLVDNAIKYTEHGRVLFGCRRRGDRVRFEICDTGPGIPKDQRELIFQDFYQIDNEARKRTQGLGLGLSIVKRMADLMGCKMGCESTMGKGSVFWIEVPTAQDVQPTDLRITSRAPAEAIQPGEGHIFLVEDDEQVLMGMKSLLETQGYTTQAVNEGSRSFLMQALTGKQRVPDLIVADYRLESQVTGSEAIQTIREILGCEIPAIIITGDTAPERLREAKKSGFPILHKPVRPEALITAIRQALGNAPEQDAG